MPIWRTLTTERSSFIRCYDANPTPIPLTRATSHDGECLIRMPTVDDSTVEAQAGFVAALDELGPLRRSTPVRPEGHGVHAFASRTMLRPEKCGVCGKRIPFYKAVSKCANCPAVCHPQCQPFVRSLLSRFLAYIFFNRCSGFYDWMKMARKSFTCLASSTRFLPSITSRCLTALTHASAAKERQRRRVRRPGV